jgi:hypothetical protein
LASRILGLTGFTLTAIAVHGRRSPSRDRYEPGA